MAKVTHKAVKPEEVSHLYEMVIILRSSIADEDAAKVVDKVKAAVDKGAGEVVRIDNMGRRKLAYEVKKEKKGLYFLIYFKVKGAKVFDIQRVCRLDESVIKYMMTRAQSSDVPLSVPAENGQTDKKGDMA
ncbi:MAG: 30S ribosomal protein S6 [Nitrospirota bacterium]